MNCKIFSCCYKYCLPAVLVFALGCNSPESEKTAKVTKERETVSDQGGVHEISARLRQMTPLTNEEWMGWLPESLGEYERSSYVLDREGVMNVSSIEGSYKNGEGSLFKIEILDGAGPSGSTLLVGYLMIADFQKEIKTSTRHAQYLERNGLKARQTYYSDANKTELQFVFDERFGVLVNTRKLTPEETWELVDQMNISRLKELGQQD